MPLGRPVRCHRSLSKDVVEEAQLHDVCDFHAAAPEETETLRALGCF